MAVMLDGEIEKPRQRVSNKMKVFAGRRVRFPGYLEMIWIIILCSAKRAGVHLALLNRSNLMTIALSVFFFCILCMPNNEMKFPL